MQKLKMIIPILGLFLSTGFSAPQQIDSLLRQLNHCASAAKSALKGNNSFDEAELARIEPELVAIEQDMRKEFANLKEHKSRASKCIKKQVAIFDRMREHEMVNAELLKRINEIKPQSIIKFEQEIYKGTEEVRGKVQKLDEAFEEFTKSSNTSGKERLSQLASAIDTLFPKKTSQPLTDSTDIKALKDKIPDAVMDYRDWEYRCLSTLLWAKRKTFQPLRNDAKHSKKMVHGNIAKKLFAQGELTHLWGKNPHLKLWDESEEGVLEGMADRISSNLKNKEQLVSISFDDHAKGFIVTLNAYINYYVHRFFDSMKSCGGCTKSQIRGLILGLSRLCDCAERAKPVMYRHLPHTKKPPSKKLIAKVDEALNPGAKENQEALENLKALSSGLSQLKGQTKDEDFVPIEGE